MKQNIKLPELRDKKKKKKLNELQMKMILKKVKPEMSYKLTWHRSLLFTP